MDLIDHSITFIKRLDPKIMPHGWQIIRLINKTPPPSTILTRLKHVLGTRNTPNWLSKTAGRTQNTYHLSLITYYLLLITSYSSVTSIRLFGPIIQIEPGCRNTKWMGWKLSLEAEKCWITKMLKYEFTIEIF